MCSFHAASLIFTSSARDQPWRVQELLRSLLGQVCPDSAVVDVLMVGFAGQAEPQGSGSTRQPVCEPKRAVETYSDAHAC